MQKWVAKAAVAFVLRQLAKFGTGTDWTQVKADAVARLTKMVPSWAVASMEEVVSQVVDAVQAALMDTTDLTAIVDALVAQDWTGAVVALEALLAKSIHVHAAVAMEALKA